MDEQNWRELEGPDVDAHWSEGKTLDSMTRRGQYGAHAGESGAGDQAEHLHKGKHTHISEISSRVAALETHTLPVPARGVKCPAQAKRIRLRAGPHRPMRATARVSAVILE